MPANAAAVGLRLIEREISVGDQLIDGHPVVRGDRDAGAAADVQRVISDVEWLRQLIEHCARDLVDDAGIAAAWHDDDEFIPAEPEHPCHLAAPLAHLRQSVADLDQQLIALGMAQGVIHILEVIEIKEGERGGAGTAVAREQPSQLLLQREPVGQPRQWVVMRQPFQLLLNAAPAGDVLPPPRQRRGPSRRDCASERRRASTCTAVPSLRIRFTCTSRMVSPAAARR